MNSHERYQRRFGVLESSRTPEWLTKEECTVENNRKHRNIRMSRRLLIVCILVIGLLAMSGLTYAATGKTITENVKIYLSDGNTEDQTVTTEIDEEGEESVYGNQVDLEFPLDENNEGSVKIVGDGWEIESGFSNPYGVEAPVEEGDCEEAEGQEAPADEND